jgi:uncharacterized protein YndB with AHSA1/START domain
MGKKISITRNLKVAPTEVFRAFSNATVLREWLCEVATVVPREGGRFYLWWDHGSFIAGKITRLIPNEKMEIRCQGCNEPTPTKITLTLKKIDQGTELEIKESGFSDDDEGKKLKQRVEHRWEVSLDNLVNVLEKGPDLRVVNRPMLGIFLDGLDEKKAAKIGVPVSKGVLVAGLVEGMGAQSSGVQKNDVIVKMDGKPVTDFQSLGEVLHNHKAGDSVETQLYRKHSLETLWVKLSYRPIPEIPKTALGLSEALAKIYGEKFSELKKSFAGINEEMANTPPKKGEWSACEVLAHLIHVERDQQTFLNNIVFDQELVSDGYGDNLESRVKATAAAYGSAKDLLDEFQLAMKETTLLLAGLPSKFVQHKGSYWRMAFNLLQFPQHTDEHNAQIRAGFEILKKKAAKN